MIISAKLKNARISEMKMRPILKKLKGLPLEKAVDFLSFSTKKASFLVKKLLQSVIANAEHNNSIDVENLFIYRIYVSKGTRLKRFRARAKGRSNTIIKRSCHVFVEAKEKL